MRKYFLPILFLATTFHCTPQRQESDPTIRTGAERMNAYLPLLTDKAVGLFVNHTSRVGSTLLVDTLLARGVAIRRVFTPEHGYKGVTPDGETIEYDAEDLPYHLVSLYGSSKRPSSDQIKELDVLVIDIQDVGVRFYTYASTMTYLMEACAKLGVPVLLLDRPNPNGSYVDGPVLDEAFESFIGLHPIPIVHGCTLGELALMINGEGWLKDGLSCELEVVRVENWNHEMPYSLPVPPSPNLPNDLAVAMYPSLALFEGTVVSVGRGTDHPFQVIGHPAYTEGEFTFIPNPNQGSKYPPLEGKICKGINFQDKQPEYGFTLKYLVLFHRELKDKIPESFFKAYFTNLAGSTQLQKQIEEGKSEEEIRNSWAADLETYKRLREKYLLYK